MKKFAITQHMLRRAMAVLVAVVLVCAQGCFANAADSLPDTITIQESLLGKQVSNPESKYVIPFESRFSDIRESNTVIDAICSIDKENAKIVGTVKIAGEAQPLKLEGVAKRDEENAVIIMTLSGKVASSPCAAVFNYDETNRCSFVTMSIGELSQTKSIMDLSFGSFTKEIETANAKIIEGFYDETVAEQGDARSIVLRDSDFSVHRKTGYFSISGSKMFALSTYFPTAVSRGQAFKFRNKLTTNNANILSYIKNNVDSSAAGPIRVYSATIVSRANSTFVEQWRPSPGTCSNTVTIYIPYFFGTNPLDPTNYGIFTRTITMESVTQWYDETSSYTSKSTHVFHFGTLGSVANTDYGNQTPNATTNGLTVAHNTYYNGTGASSIKLYADATVVAGYVGDGPRPGSRIVKSAALGSLTINDTLTIQ